MTITYTSIFNCKTLQNVHKFVFLIWKDAIWQTCWSVASLCSRIFTRDANGHVAHKTLFFSFPRHLLQRFTVPSSDWSSATRKISDRGTWTLTEWKICMYSCDAQWPCCLRRCFLIISKQTCYSKSVKWFKTPSNYIYQSIMPRYTSLPVKYIVSTSWNTSE
jgi:hypothetical protein